jgi:hypothetical protein
MNRVDLLRHLSVLGHHCRPDSMSEFGLLISQVPFMDDRDLRIALEYHVPALLWLRTDNDPEVLVSLQYLRNFARSLPR